MKDSDFGTAGLPADTTTAAVGEPIAHVQVHELSELPGAKVTITNPVDDGFDAWWDQQDPAYQDAVDMNYDVAHEAWVDGAAEAATLPPALAMPRHRPAGRKPLMTGTTPADIASDIYRRGGTWDQVLDAALGPRTAEIAAEAARQERHHIAGMLNDRATNLEYPDGVDSFVVNELRRIAGLLEGDAP